MKFNPANSISENLKKAEPIFKKYNPSYPFEYNFLDKQYAAKFADEKRTGETVGSFCGPDNIHILPRPFWFGHVLQRKTGSSEIGIRKVLGASVFGITQLLSFDFFKLVTISFLIASPIAWYAMNSWLQSYTYRIQITWWVFALTFLVCRSL